MSKSLFITEKPSVAVEFAKALGIKGARRGGFIDSEDAVITWCVGHLVTMSYPEAYDSSLKKWSLKDLPFLPHEYRYEVIEQVKNQFDIIKGFMNNPDITKVYVCTDSGREGEYIYRLVDQMIGVDGKEKKRVWIDSQTVDEIKRGVKEAKPLAYYDKLSDSAYLRAKEDYLIGINFSRLLTLIYGNTISNFLGTDFTVIAVGRVMSCVLGMIVSREREIREFIKTPYYKIASSFVFEDTLDYEGEWKSVEGSKYHLSKLLFKDIGFREKKDAQKFISDIEKANPEKTGIIESVEKKTEKKNPPLLYNLAELQNDCSKKYKISPDETLKVVQSLYEKKMLTYPRTDARVLTKAVAGEIDKNIKPLLNIEQKCVLGEDDKELSGFIRNVWDNGLYKGLSKTRYVDDSRVTDHYAIIPTGQGLSSFNKLSPLEKDIFILVLRRLLAIFYPQAIYNKLTITTKVDTEKFFTSSKVCTDRGYLDVLEKSKADKTNKTQDIETLKKLKKGQTVQIKKFEIKESETTPPKRYNSGAMILAMENAGKLIEDDDLREQIKSNGIGTSATRAEILNKLEKIKYTSLNTKTQIVTPTPMGEMIYDVVNNSVPSLLKPELTASWEKGLAMVSNGEIGTDEYMTKLENYIKKNTDKVMNLKNNEELFNVFSKIPDNNQGKPKTVRKREVKNALGSCTICETGQILENKKAFFCTNWREGCKFTVWKNCLESLGLDVTPEMIEELLENKKLENVYVVKANSDEKVKATLILDKNNIEVKY